MKTNEQVRTHSNAFPTEKEYKIVRTQNEQEHRKDEQIQVGKKLVISGVMAHVTHRKQVDQ